MAKSKILTGARAVLQINNDFIGFFTTCTWEMRQDKVPAFVCGKYGPVEITPTAQEAVRMSVSGFRVRNSGPYAKLGATELKDLLNENDFTVTIYDRGPADANATADNTISEGNIVFRAVGCRVAGWSSGVAARGVSDVRIDIIGLKGEDEKVIADQGRDEPEIPGTAF